MPAGVILPAGSLMPTSLAPSMSCVSARTASPDRVRLSATMPTARTAAAVIIEPDRSAVMTVSPKRKLPVPKRTGNARGSGPNTSSSAYVPTKLRARVAVIDRTSPYALTGAVFARERAAVRQAASALRNAAGNFYINDKPTGAVVGQQPFGGARGSGTNDKAGSKLNLVRWASARTIKETLAPPRDYRYPFMAEE